MRSDTTPLSARGSNWLPWLLAGIGFAFDIAAFWPGQMSFDSAYAWWQARGGETSTLVPPIFVLVWRGSRLLVDGPGAMFALDLVLFWVGLALIARALRGGMLATSAMFAAVGLAPVVLLLRGHVWTDVALFASLVFATGLLATASRDTRRRFQLAALCALVYAGLLRHNAVPAIVPLLAWLAAIALRGDGAEKAPSRWRVAIVTALATVAVVFLGIALNASVQRRIPLWPSLAQFDLAAISIETGTLQLPTFMHGPGLDMADLEQAYRPWSNTPMLRNTRAGLRDPFDPPFSDDQIVILRRAWIDAIIAQPDAWLRHRWRVTRALFGTHAPDWPNELVFVDAQVQYRTNPTVAANTGALHRLVMRAANALVATPVLAAWPWLALGLLPAPWALRRRKELAAKTALICLASAWLYALPLCVLAPSAELRYLAWPCVASLIALACSCFGRRADTAR